MKAGSLRNRKKSNKDLTRDLRNVSGLSVYWDYCIFQHFVILSKNFQKLSYQLLELWVSISAIHCAVGPSNNNVDLICTLTSALTLNSIFHEPKMWWTWARRKELGHSYPLTRIFSFLSCYKYFPQTFLLQVCWHQSTISPHWWFSRSKQSFVSCT